MSTRRQVLNNVSVGNGFSPHAGLWLDKYLDGSRANDAKQSLVSEVASLPLPALYLLAYERWRQGLCTLAPTVDSGATLRLGHATVRGRMVVGLGAEAVLENSITLQHTYGVPFIPGSALKGLAAAYANQRVDNLAWHRPTKVEAKEEAEGQRTVSDHTLLFGSGHSAGYVTFFDAWFIPQGKQPLHADVLTVHHQEYYSGGAAPADWDSPIPAPFLSATGTYLIALAGPKDWVDTAFTILHDALNEMGVGAKTSSGYGRMNLVPEPGGGSFPL